MITLRICAPLSSVRWIYMRYRSFYWLIDWYHMTMVFITWQWCISHDNSAYHMTMVHITWQWCISHDNGVYNMTMVHITWQWCISHDNDVYNMTMVHITWQWCISHDNGAYHMTIRDDTMAKAVSSHKSAWPSCIIKRVIGLVSPEDRRSRAMQDPWPEGEYN